ncbi:MAG: MFS transporter, partial [Alphaproteobacteria bacterium]
MSARGFAILFPFLLTPIASFLFRMVNATITPELVAEFQLGPAELGFVTSAFFVGFGLAQLPMGVLLDRFGPRPVVIVLQLIGAFGGVVFVLATNEAGLLFGRFLIGVGMAGSVMAGLKAANLWFERGRLPAISALLFGMTGFGGMLATGPLALL